MSGQDPATLSSRDLQGYLDRFLAEDLPAETIATAVRKNRLRTIGERCVALSHAWAHDELRFQAIRAKMALVNDHWRRAAGTEPAAAWLELAGATGGASPPGAGAFAIACQPSNPSLAPAPVPPQWPRERAWPEDGPRPLDIVVTVRAAGSLRLQIFAAGNNQQPIFAPPEEPSVPAGERIFRWNWKHGSPERHVYVTECPLLVVVSRPGVPDEVARVNVEPWVSAKWERPPGELPIPGVAARTDASGRALPARPGVNNRVTLRVRTAGIPPQPEGAVRLRVLQSLGESTTAPLDPPPAFPPLMIDAAGNATDARGAAPVWEILWQPGIYATPYYRFTAQVTVEGRETPLSASSGTAGEDHLRIRYPVKFVSAPTPDLYNLMGACMYLERAFTVDAHDEDYGGANIDPVFEGRTIGGQYPLQHAAGPQAGRQMSQVAADMDGKFFYLQASHGNQICQRCRNAGRISVVSHGERDFRCAITGNAFDPAAPTPGEFYIDPTSPRRGPWTIRSRQRRAQSYGAFVVVEVERQGVRRSLYPPDWAIGADSVVAPAGDIAAVPTGTQVEEWAPVLVRGWLKLDTAGACSHCGNNDLLQLDGGYLFENDTFFSVGEVEQYLNVAPTVVGACCCLTGNTRSLYRALACRGMRYAFAFRTAIFVTDAIGFANALVPSWRQRGFRLDRFEEAFREVYCRGNHHVRMQPRLFRGNGRIPGELELPTGDDR